MCHDVESNSFNLSGVRPFLFFKQKTAYEMRISDWSSDVCSSDLPTVLHVHPCRHRRDGAVQLARPPGEVGRRVDAEVLEERRVGAQQEIGSASCRERVCQYV